MKTGAALAKPISSSEPSNKAVQYVSKTPDSNDFIKYSEEENETWSILYRHQMKMVKGRACDEFIDGLKTLQMGANRIPQLGEINRKLSSLTGWQVERVPALIGFEHFFDLLAHRKFPAATFIRTRDDLDYIKEPDIFHELFGHCPLLTNQAYADFSQHYGKIGLTASPEDRAMLARLYWFTIEFGLVKTKTGLKIYGGGILSSKEETAYSLESPLPNRLALNTINAFRTYYRIDQLQKNYFVIDALSDLQRLIKLDLFGLIRQARVMGMKPSDYVPREGATC